jgi:hypothetical protein
MKWERAHLMMLAFLIDQIWQQAGETRAILMPPCAP